MWKITREDCSDLGFAINCLFNQAICLQEFKLWIEILLKDLSTDEIPLYVYDLMDFEGALADIDNVIGFVAPCTLTKQQEEAVVGIAYLRNVNIYDPTISKERALISLQKNPGILKKFKCFFPFIYFPEYYSA